MPDTSACKPWIVLKFGGTSVARAELWHTIAARARALLAEQRVWIVVSALAGVTDALERAIEQACRGAAPQLDGIRDAHASLARALGLAPGAMRGITALLSETEICLAGVRTAGEASPPVRARVLATGELAATQLGLEALRRSGLQPCWLDARELLVSEETERTDERQAYLDARVPVRLAKPADDPAAGRGELVLTQGFIARRPSGATCLLGRGGSDTSAALFAALLGARALEIWTDVPGLFTADPRLVPEARLIRRIGYREARELATMGAKVLHPRCLAPVEAAGIPIDVRSTECPDLEGTRVEATGEEHPAVIAVTCRSGVTLLSLSTLAMWREPGFLARVFAPCDELGISIDLVATSQTSIALTFDTLPGGASGPALRALADRLRDLGELRIVHPCATVSIIGRRIRAALPEIGAALSAFQERPVHLLSDSAEDLDLSFVVDESDARPLVGRLHERLFAGRDDEVRFGPTWERLGPRPSSAHPRRCWWRARRAELLELATGGRACFVYDLAEVARTARELRCALPSADRLYYAMKANAHPRILETLAAAGFGFECVSAAEVERARAVAGSGVPLLFTPNFCPAAEYERAAALGADLVVDGPEPLALAPSWFAGQAIGLRIDPGRGRGHHDKVRTAGPASKFGCALDGLDAVVAAAARTGTRIVGLHAHVGSGIFAADSWAATGRLLLALRTTFPDVAWIDLGGGLGVPERVGQPPLDLAAVEQGLAGVRADAAGVELRLEPGRYLVSDAGVLLAPVTQVRNKSGVRFVGLATGMNSLIRPALYGAWHGMHNLTRLDDPAEASCHVVGPICESGDVLGLDRLLPETSPGDVVLIENAGAYGAVMASCYNLRPPAAELTLD